MKRLIGRTLFILVAIIVSPFMAHVTATLNHYVIGEVGGYFYLFVVAPFMGLVLGLILLLLLRHCTEGVLAHTLSFIVVVLLSSAIHFAMLRNHQISGWYILPKDFTASHSNYDELYSFVYSRNHEIRGRAFTELKKRGQSSADTLLRIIENNKRLEDTQYIDDYITWQAVETLASLKDRRVIPTLKEMLTSQKYYTETAKVKRRVYLTRKEAKKLLEDSFGIKVDTQIEENM